MIRVRQDGVEREITYDEFVREVRAGRITGSTMVLGDVLTSGVWKPAIELQFFRTWAPAGSVPPRPAPASSPAEAPDTEAPSPEEPTPRASDRAGWDAPRRSWETREDSGSSRWERGDLDSLPPPDLGAAAEADRIPWERQEEIGFVRGLYGTIRLAFDDAVEYARRIGAGSLIMPSLVFGIVITAITAIFDAVYGIGALHLAKGLVEQMESQMPELFGQAGTPTARDVIFLEGMRILFYPLTIFIWSGLIHLFLRLFSRPIRPFATTFRVASYAVAPMILNILPVCGVMIGVVWMVFLTIRGLTIVQKTGTFASIIAVLLPVLGYLIWVTLANPGMMRALPHLGGSG
jgi:hypothetical protein